MPAAAARYRQAYMCPAGCPVWGMHPKSLVQAKLPALSSSFSSLERGGFQEIGLVACGILGFSFRVQGGFKNFGLWA